LMMILWREEGAHSVIDQTGPGMEPKTGIFHRTRTMSSKIPEIPVPEN
jgi:hypothetical protein